MTVGMAFRQFLAGIRAALPVMAGYLPIAVSFGLVSHEAGFPPALAALMSAIVYAGASQFAALSMLIAGTAVPEIVLATFFMNLRHVVMTLALMGRAPIPSRAQRFALAAGITDETFAVASFTRDERVLTAPGLAGLIVSAWASWWLGSVIGVHAAGLVPKALNQAMGVMLYGLFIGLLVPAVRRAPKGLTIALTAMAVHTGLRMVMPQGWALVAAIVAGATVGPVLGRRRV